MMMMMMMIMIIIIIIFTAFGLSPVGSDYFTCKQNMKLVTTKFKLGGLREKHVVATWNLGNHLRANGITKTLCLGNIYLLQGTVLLRSDVWGTNYRSCPHGSKHPNPEDGTDRLFPNVGNK